jgi:predicted kinase
MRQLPDERSLGMLLHRDAAGPAEVVAVARRVAQFHGSAATGPEIDRFGRPAVIRRNVEENFEQTAVYAGSVLPVAVFEEIAGYARGFLRHERPTFTARIEQRRIRDGHGDLRCEHVYLLPEVTIIDAIEFNRRFRYADTAADLAFLAMDLDHLGYPDYADLLVDEYRRAGGDDPGALLDFYRCYRAYVRAKVALLLSGESEVPENVRSAARIEARGYANLSLRYARGDHRPGLILITGLSGSGKSTLAAALGPAVGAPVLAADPVRKRLAGLAPDDHRWEARDAGIYSPGMNAKVYDWLHDEAGKHLAKGRLVILDATYRRGDDRDSARAVALSKGARLLVVECRAGEGTIVERLAARAASPNEASDATIEVYRSQLESARPYTGLAPGEHLVVDTERPIDEQVAAVFERLE